MTKALVNEINTFIEFSNDENFDSGEIRNLFSVYQDLNIEFLKMKILNISLMKDGLAQ